MNQGSSTGPAGLGLMDTTHPAQTPPKAPQQLPGHQLCPALGGGLGAGP